MSSKTEHVLAPEVEKVVKKPKKKGSSSKQHVPVQPPSPASRSKKRSKDGDKKENTKTSKKSDSTKDSSKGELPGRKESATTEVNSRGGEDITAASNANQQHTIPQPPSVGQLKKTSEGVENKEKKKRKKVMLNLGPATGPSDSENCTKDNNTAPESSGDRIRRPSGSMSPPPKALLPPIMGHRAHSPHNVAGSPRATGGDMGVASNRHLAPSTGSPLLSTGGNNNSILCDPLVPIEKRGPFQPVPPKGMSNDGGAQSSRLPPGHAPVFDPVGNIGGIDVLTTQIDPATAKFGALPKIPKSLLSGNLKMTKKMQMLMMTGSNGVAEGTDEGAIAAY